MRILNGVAFDIRGLGIRQFTETGPLNPAVIKDRANTLNAILIQRGPALKRNK